MGLLRAAALRSTPDPEDGWSGQVAWQLTQKMERGTGSRTHTHGTTQGNCAQKRSVGVARASCGATRTIRVRPNPEYCAFCPLHIRLSVRLGLDCRGPILATQ